jgi:hypothetical protein
MFVSRQQRSAVAARVALGLVVASTLVVGAPVDAAPTHTYTNHKPLSSNYPASYTARPADALAQSTAQAYPNPEYPNHKPSRGNYPGSYTRSPPTPAHRATSRFDWLAAGIGAAGMLGLILMLTAVKTGARIARNRRHDAPLVVQIDDHPGVG